MKLPELAAAMQSPIRAEELAVLSGTPYVFVDVDDEPWPSFAGAAGAASAASAVNCPVLAISRRTVVPDVVDLVVGSPEEGALVTDAIRRNPVAAMALVQLLRHNERVSVGDGLFAESLAYSALQHGAEFRSWLAARTKRPARPEPRDPAVLIARTGDELRITLNRPHKRNAYSGGLRDALCEALGLAAEDASIVKVVLDGAGVCFSAGGDLDEFGEAKDAGIAHASRMTRSAGALIHRLRDRVEARVHGACIGAGIELPAFAGHLVARADAFFQLPEVGMGLIPGAGGTASLLPRIGRRRLALMALTGMRVDAETALAWGLVDSIEGQ